MKQADGSLVENKQENSEVKPTEIPLLRTSTKCVIHERTNWLSLAKWMVKKYPPWKDVPSFEMTTTEICFNQQSAESLNNLVKAENQNLCYDFLFRFVKYIANTKKLIIRSEENNILLSPQAIDALLSKIIVRLNDLQDLTMDLYVDPTSIVCKLAQCRSIKSLTLSRMNFAPFAQYVTHNSQSGQSLLEPCASITGLQLKFSDASLKELNELEKSHYDGDDQLDHIGNFFELLARKMPNLQRFKIQDDTTTFYHTVANKIVDKFLNKLPLLQSIRLDFRGQVEPIDNEQSKIKYTMAKPVLSALVALIPSTSLTEVELPQIRDFEYFSKPEVKQKEISIKSAWADIFSLIIAAAMVGKSCQIVINFLNRLGQLNKNSTIFTEFEKILKQIIEGDYFTNTFACAVDVRLDFNFMLEMFENGLDGRKVRRGLLDPDVEQFYDRHQEKHMGPMRLSLEALQDFQRSIDRHQFKSAAPLIDKTLESASLPRVISSLVLSYYHLDQRKDFFSRAIFEKPNPVRFNNFQLIKKPVDLNSLCCPLVCNIDLAQIIKMSQQVKNHQQVVRRALLGHRSSAIRIIIAKNIQDPSVEKYHWLEFINEILNTSEPEQLEFVFQYGREDDEANNKALLEKMNQWACCLAYYLKPPASVIGFGIQGRIDSAVFFDAFRGWLTKSSKCLEKLAIRDVEVKMLVDHRHLTDAEYTFPKLPRLHFIELSPDLQSELQQEDLEKHKNQVLPMPGTLLIKYWFEPSRLNEGSDLLFNNGDLKKLCIDFTPPGFFTGALSQTQTRYLARNILMQLKALIEKANRVEKFTFVVLVKKNLLIDDELGHYKSLQDSLREALQPRFDVGELPQFNIIFIFELSDLQLQLNALLPIFFKLLDFVFTADSKYSIANIHWDVEFKFKHSCSHQPLIGIRELHQFIDTRPFSAKAQIRLQILQAYSDLFDRVRTFSDITKKPLSPGVGRRGLNALQDAVEKRWDDWCHTKQSILFEKKVNPSFTELREKYCKWLRAEQTCVDIIQLKSAAKLPDSLLSLFAQKMAAESGAILSQLGNLEENEPQRRQRSGVCRSRRVRVATKKRKHSKDCSSSSDESDTDNCRPLKSNKSKHKDTGSDEEYFPETPVRRRFKKQKKFTARLRSNRSSFRLLGVVSDFSFFQQNNGGHQRNNSSSSTNSKSNLGVSAVGASYNDPVLSWDVPPAWEGHVTSQVFWR